MDTRDRYHRSIVRAPAPTLAGSAQAEAGDLWKRPLHLMAGVLAGTLLLVGGLTACSGSSPKKAAPSSATPTTAARGQVSPPATGGGRHVTLDLASGGTVQANLPKQPLGTTPSIAPGVDLEVWQARRSGPTVTVVFSLHDTSGSSDTSLAVPDETNLEEALDLNVSNPNASISQKVNNVANNVGLLDTTKLKDYETFCNVGAGGALTNCLATVDNINLSGGERQFLAAVVAAPPASVTSATLVTGVGSIPNVPISG